MSLEESFLSIHQRIDVVSGDLKSMSMRDCIRGTSLDAISAKNAPGIVNVINTSVSFASRNSVNFCILCCFNVDTIRRARCSTKEASNALFETFLVAVQYMNPTVARFEMDRLFRIILCDRLPHHIPQSYAKAFNHGNERPANLIQNGAHGPSFYQADKLPANSPSLVTFGREEIVVRFLMLW